MTSFNQLNFISKLHELLNVSSDVSSDETYANARNNLRIILKFLNNVVYIYNIKCNKNQDINDDGFDMHPIGKASMSKIINYIMPLFTRYYLKINSEKNMISVILPLKRLLIKWIEDPDMPCFIAFESFMTRDSRYQKIKLNF